MTSAQDTAVSGKSISADEAVREAWTGPPWPSPVREAVCSNPMRSSSRSRPDSRRRAIRRDLTIVHSMGLGDKTLRSMTRLAKTGLVAKIIGGHMGNSRVVGEMILNKEVGAYNLPLGVLSQLFRDTAAGRPGLLTKTGLGTFVDPRQRGGSLNDISNDQLVELMEIDGEEYLFYKAIPADFTFVRGSRADRLGNIVYDDEPSYLDTLEACMAGYRGGASRPGPGRVFLRVESVSTEQFHPKKVHIPGVPGQRRRQSIIVMGGRRGIGRAIAVDAAEAGARVAVMARGDSQDTVAHLRSLGAEAMAVQGDVAKAADAQRAVDETVGAFGRLDVLVNNAAVLHTGPLLDLSEESIRSTLDANVKGVLLMTQAAARVMTAQRDDVVINIGSDLALRGRAEYVAYCASKGAVLQITTSTAVELGRTACAW